MNLKTIGITLLVCLAFMGTAMAYQTIVQVTFDSGTYSGQAVDHLRTGTAKIYDVAEVVIPSGSKSYDYWYAGATQSIGPVTLTDGNLYGIRVSYYHLYSGGAYTTMAYGYIPCLTTSCTSQDYMWFIA